MLCTAALQHGLPKVHPRGGSADSVETVAAPPQKVKEEERAPPGGGADGPGSVAPPGLGSGKTETCEPKGKAKAEALTPWEFRV